ARAASFLIENVVAARRPVRLPAILLRAGEILIAHFCEVEHRNAPTRAFSRNACLEHEAPSFGGERRLERHERGPRCDLSGRALSALRAYDAQLLVAVAVRRKHDLPRPRVPGGAGLRDVVGAVRD